MSETNVSLRRFFTALTIATLPITSVATAQDGAPPIERSGSRTPEIIVTAQKRAQSLQDVPIVVTAVSEQLLQDTGVKDIKDLSILAPGLLVTSSSNESFTTARIRGIGTVGDNPGLESSVGIVIDGVYRPRNGVSFGDLGELERIEVLKGPQSTLFGKNTSAGVISVVSKKPSFNFSANADLTTGNFDTLEASGSVTGPLSKILAGRLYVASRERDGYLDVIRGSGPRDADDDNDRKVHTARGQLLLKPFDAFSILFAGDYTDRDENCCVASQVQLTPITGLLQILDSLQPGSFRNPADPFARVAYANRSTEQAVTDKGTSMEINWKLDALGGASVTSITAWRDWESINGQDLDFTAVDLLYRSPDGNFANEFKQLTQEVRLSGESQKLSWLVGGFYAGEDLNSRDQLVYGTQFQQYFNLLLSGAISAFPSAAYPANGEARDRYRQKSQSWALFTNNSVRFTDSLEMTVGLRYTDESKDLDAQYANTHGGLGCSILRGNPLFVNNANAATIFGIGCNPVFADPIFNNAATFQTLDEHEWSGAAKIAYHFTSDVMTYLSYARGYKASGFNLYRERNGDGRFGPGSGNPAAVSVDTDTHFGKELVDSYELGAKTQWADNSLLLNGAVFYQDYTDYQLNTFTGLQFIVTSLPRVVSQGIDVDMVWYAPFRKLSVQGGITYAQTTIEEYGAALALFRPERKDDTLSFAPRWSTSLSATYEQPLGVNFALRGNIGAKYTSEYNTGSNLDPRKTQDAMTIMNARVGFGTRNGKWLVELWAQNLTDEKYYQVAIDATLQGSSAGAIPTSTIDAFLGAPRTYGVTLRSKF